MTDESSIIANSPLPVETVDDVIAEWSTDVYDATTYQPILQAVIAGQAAMLLAYQDASAFAADQSDPLRATDEYEDEIGWELAVHRQKNQGDDDYRSRFFREATVSPEDIIAAANTALAPFTSTSCVYFEHLDAWHVRETYLDIVSATNASPIVIGIRFAIPPTFQTGSSVSVSNVAGNTAANGTWIATAVMGPVIVTRAFSFSPTPPTVTLTGTPLTGATVTIQILNHGVLSAALFALTVNGVAYQISIATGLNVPLPGTGLIAHFAVGTYDTFTVYQASPNGLSLSTVSGPSTGNGSYTGSGSVVLAAEDPALTPALWSSHVYGDTYSTPNYPDRHYGSLPHRFSGGARAFSDVNARIFWLLAPDVSGIDANVAGLFDGYLDIVAISNTAPIVVTTAFALPTASVNGMPPEIANGSSVILAGTTQVVALSGGATFHVTHGSATVTATGSHFTTELVPAVPTALAPNSRIFFGGTTAADQYEVSAIGSDTSLTLNKVYTGPTSTTATGFTYGPLCDNLGLPWQITVTGPNSFSLNGSSASGIYSGGGSVQTSATYSVDGFYCATGITLVGALSVTHSSPGTLDGTHELAQCHSGTGTTSVHLPASPSDGQNAAVEDVDGQATGLSSAIVLQTSGGIPFENPFHPGSYALLLIMFSSVPLYVVWVYDMAHNRWILNRGESYVWSIASTAADIYGTLVADVDAIRGQSMRWYCWVDPKLD